jgi:hypothetical protein
MSAWIVGETQSRTDLWFGGVLVRNRGLIRHAGGDPAGRQLQKQPLQLRAAEVERAGAGCFALDELEVRVTQVMQAASQRRGASLAAAIRRNQAALVKPERPG